MDLSQLLYHVPPMRLNVKILTYNVFLRINGVSHGCRKHGADQKDARLEALLDTIGDYDVVMLQEMWNGGVLLPGRRRRQILIEHSKRLGFKWSVTPPKPNILKRKFLDSGLVILSKYPIEQKKCFVFDAGCTVDNLAAKGAMFAKIRLPNRETLSVYNTHLQASYDISANGRFRKTVQVREQQLIQLLKFVRSTTYPMEARIIAGDFNINSFPSEGVSTAEFTNLIENVFQEYSTAIPRGKSSTIELYQDPSSGKEVTSHVPRVCSQCLSTDGTAARKSLISIPMCLDHVLYQNVKLSSAAVIDYPLPGSSTYLSDHKAVCTEFVVGKESNLNPSEEQ